MWDKYQNSEPQVVAHNEWHLPYISEEEKSKIYVHELRQLSVARCARVSYLNHDGERNPFKDFDLYNRLKENGHWSAFEHVATPLHDVSQMSGNFRGWKQFRKTFANECVKE